MPQELTLTSSTVSLVDLNDIYTSPSEPSLSSRTDGMYWIDQSSVPYVLKQWMAEPSPGRWVNLTASSLEELDEAAKDILDNINNDVNNPSLGIKTQIKTINTSIGTINDTVALKADKTEIVTFQTSNILYNTEWKIGNSLTDGWILNDNWVISNVTTLEKSNTAKCFVNSASSITALNALTSINYPAQKNKKYTFSVYIYVDNLASIDDAVYMEIEFLNGIQILDSQKNNIKPATNKTWIRKSFTITSPAEALEFRVKFYPTKNGDFYIAKPMLQYGETLTNWCASTNDSMVYPIQQRVSGAEQIISPEQIINVVTKSNAYLNDLGNNKWLLKRYTMSEETKTKLPIIPSINYMVAQSADQTIEVPDTKTLAIESLLGAGYAYYIISASTYVYAENSCPVTLMPTHSSGASLYINNKMWYSEINAVTTPVTKLINFLKGWNRIDIFWYKENYDKPDYFDLGLIITEHKDYSGKNLRINCYVDIDSISKSYIVQTANNLEQAVQRIDEHDGNITTMNTKIEQNANAISLQVEELKLRTPQSSFRYIRSWLNGNTVNSGNHWVELEVYSGGTNIALNCTVIASSTFTNLNYYTDGIKTTNPYITGGSGWQWLQVDLGSIVDNVDYITDYHYFSDGRQYNYKLEVSTDGTKWYELYNSDKQGKYKEISAGKTFIINDTHIMSKFTQTASDISLKVSKGAIISEINQTAEAIKIQAAKIDLTGYATFTSLSDPTSKTVINGSLLTTGAINASLITTGTLDASKITVSNLVVGTNVTMGPDARISWGQITNPPSMPAGYSDSQAIAAIRSTYIDANGVWTPRVYAGNVVAGTLSAMTLDSAKITGSNVEISSALKLKPPSDASNPFSTSAWIKFYKDATNTVDLYYSPLIGFTINDCVQTIGGIQAFGRINIQDAYGYNSGYIGVYEVHSSLLYGGTNTSAGYVKVNSVETQSLTVNGVSITGGSTIAKFG